jgi:hypothetical protein
MKELKTKGKVVTNTLELKILELEKKIKRIEKYLCLRVKNIPITYTPNKNEMEKLFKRVGKSFLDEVMEKFDDQSNKT